MQCLTHLIKILHSKCNTNKHIANVFLKICYSFSNLQYKYNSLLIFLTFWKSVWNGLWRRLHKYSLFLKEAGFSGFVFTFEDAQNIIDSVPGKG